MTEGLIDGGGSSGRTGARRWKQRWRIAVRRASGFDARGSLRRGGGGSNGGAAARPGGRLRRRAPAATTAQVAAPPRRWQRQRRRRIPGNKAHFVTGERGDDREVADPPGAGAEVASDRGATGANEPGAGGEAADPGPPSSLDLLLCLQRPAADVAGAGDRKGSATSAFGLTGTMVAIEFVSGL